MADDDTLTRSGILPSGHIVDAKYTVKRLLGAGGFAKVYEAVQNNIDRSVALKVLAPPENARDSESYYARFLREAKVAASIDHPNVVTIYDYGVSDGRPYIAMEIQQGHELGAELDRHGGMEPARAIPLIIDVLDALGHAHAQGVVHKDLKPSNLFLSHPRDRRERLCILDFGVAGMEQGKRLTTTGKIYGTPQYLSPEYLRDRLITPALDVYQMGLILVETLTGAMVIDTDEPFVCITRHLTGELPVPASLLEGPLGPVVTTALARDYADRYADAHAFRDVLDEIDVASIEPVRSGEQTRRICDLSASLNVVAAPLGPSGDERAARPSSGPVSLSSDSIGALVGSGRLDSAGATTGEGDATIVDRPAVTHPNPIDAGEAPEDTAGPAVVAIEYGGSGPTVVDGRSVGTRTIGLLAAAIVVGIVLVLAISAASYAAWELTNSSETEVVATPPRPAPANLSEAPAVGAVEAAEPSRAAPGTADDLLVAPPVPDVGNAVAAEIPPAPDAGNAAPVELPAEAGQGAEDSPKAKSRRKSPRPRSPAAHPKPETWKPAYPP